MLPVTDMVSDNNPMKHSFKLFAMAGLLVAAISSSQAQSYYLSGDFINGWSGPQGSLMSGGPVIYTNLVTGGTAGSYEQLKVTDGTWNNSWPGSNLQIDFDANGTNTIYFIPGTFADGWFPTVNRVGYDNPGNVWEVSGDFTSPNWGDDASAQMTADVNGVLSVSYMIPVPGNYSFKFKTVGTWDGAIGADFGMNAANISITTVNANETLLFKLDLPKGRFQMLPLVTNQVVFAVDMSSQIQLGQFSPGSSVFVSGDFNSWPGTGPGALALTNYPPYRGGNNTNIYYGTNTFVGPANSVVSTTSSLTTIPACRPATTAMNQSTTAHSTCGPPTDYCCCRSCISAIMMSPVICRS